ASADRSYGTIIRAYPPSRFLVVRGYLKPLLSPIRTLDGERKQRKPVGAHRLASVISAQRTHGDQSRRRGSLRSRRGRGAFKANPASQACSGQCHGSWSAPRSTPAVERGDPRCRESARRRVPPRERVGARPWKVSAGPNV